MTQPESSAFGADTTTEFNRYYDTVRGYVREQVTRENLEEYIHGGPLSVLDIGGGEGRDAVWLAQMGHSVRLIDPSEEMAGLARRRIERSGVEGLVTVEAGNPGELLRGTHEPYDLVLSHGVLMYVDDPQSHLQLLHDNTAADGIVSILTKGKFGSIKRLYDKGEPREAYQVEQSGRMRRNNLGRDVLALNEHVMQEMLGRAALHLEEWYGVRLLSDTDDWWTMDVPPDQLAEILEMELHYSREASVKGIGQMLHFICTRKDG